MKNAAFIFTITLASSHTFFFILGNPPRVKSDTYSFEIPALSQHT